MSFNLAFSILASCAAIASYAPYIRDIHNGKTKPHAFSWFIWALLTYIAGAAQLVGGGGVGAVVAPVTATISLYIAWISWRKHRQLITRSDWIYLIIGLLAIPLWAFTKSPLLSLILIIVIDAVALIPTFRKSYRLPWSETMSSQYLTILKHILTIFAQEKMSLVTLLFPLWLALESVALLLLLIIRRKSVPAPDEHTRQK